MVDDGHGGDYVNVDINVNVNTDENIYNRRIDVSLAPKFETGHTKNPIV